MTDNPLGVDGAPTPPPAPTAPQVRATSRAARRGGRTAAGVVLAILIIVVKFGAAFGIGRWMHHGSAPVVLIGVVLLLLIGWGSRFLRL